MEFKILIHPIVFVVLSIIFPLDGKSKVAADERRPIPNDLVLDIIDGKWDQIQKGQWLIAFFDNETPESMQLMEDWPVFALKCREQNINVGQVIGPKNPALSVRFLVTFLPKVFYIKNGVAHEVKHPNRKTIFELIKDQKWKELKNVNFLSNPFSVQLSLLSHLFVHAVNLYNFEDAIVQKVIPLKSATDIAFGLTFIFVGTFLGLLLTCAFGVVQIYFMDSKAPEEENTGKGDPNVASEQENESEELEKEKSGESTSGDDNAVRKRK